MVPLMTEGGSIVNVSSRAGVSGYHAAAYGASKWAVRGLSRTASLELGPRRIRVNTLLPGYIETAMSASAPDWFREASIDEIPLGRLGTVEDIVPLIVFLMSDESSWISGCEFHVDGGEYGHAGVKRYSDLARTGGLNKES
jgi:3alpha(or 20beta)-hydroxysteroid dehydrogenase